MRRHTRRKSFRGGVTSSDEKQLEAEFEKCLKEVVNNPCVSDSSFRYEVGGTSEQALRGAHLYVLNRLRKNLSIFNPRRFEGTVSDWRANNYRERGMGRQFGETHQCTPEADRQLYESSTRLVEIHYKIEAIVKRLNNAVGKKLVDQNVRSAVERSMNIDASPGTGPADKIRGFFFTL